MALGELAKLLTHHQELEADYQAEQLEVGGFVWFSENQQPRLDKILAVDVTAPRPVTVQMFVSQANAASLSRARFRAARHEEGGKPKVTRIMMHQIQLRFQQLTTRGFLGAADRRRLDKLLMGS